MIESKSFVIPSLPPSKNMLHRIIRSPNQPLIFKRSKQYETWLSEAMPYIPMLTPLKDSHYFRVEAEFEYPFFHLNGKHRRLDGHNFLEALCDAIAAKNGFDDSYVKFGSWGAYDAENESINVTISQVRSLI